MRFLKIFLALVGIVALIAAGVFLFQSWIDIRSVVAVANANKNQDQSIASPFPKVAWATVLAAIGALTAGMAVALPRMTENGVRRHVLEAQRTRINDDIDRAETTPRHPRREHAEHRETTVVRDVAPADGARQEVITTDDVRRAD